MTCGLLWVNNLEKPACCVFKIENMEMLDSSQTWLNINLTSVNNVLESNNIYLHRFLNSASKNVTKVLEIHLTKILYYVILDNKIIFRKECYRQFRFKS
jgi:hypothetical protein